mgnify:FL=1
MGLKEEFTKFAMDTKEDRGEVMALLRSMDGHIKSVSGKADEIRKEIQTHALHPEAHGLAAGNRATTDAKGWVSLLFGAVAMAIAIWKAH